MATRFAPGITINEGTVISGINADSLPAPAPAPAPSPAPAPEPEPSSSYILSSSVNQTDEGSTVTFNLTVQEVGQGEVIPYTISGISRADIEGASLVGSFVVGETESIELFISEDELTEGQETILMSLDNGESEVGLLIQDTSLTPIVFEGTVDAGPDISVIEGSEITFDLNATLSTYEPLTDTILWEQLSGDTGTFSANDALSTSFTTAADSVEKVVLKITASRTISGVVVSKSDILNINLNPSSEVSTLSGYESRSTTDTRFYVDSILGKVDDLTSISDTILWGSAPSFNGWNYHGFVVQYWEKSIEDWKKVEESYDVSIHSYKINDLDKIYRFLPLWKKGSLVITGKSKKLLKPGLDKLGAYSRIEKVTTNADSSASNITLEKFKKTILPINRTDSINVQSKLNTSPGEINIERVLKTVQPITPESNIEFAEVNLSSKVSNINTTRTVATLVNLSA